MIRQSLRRLIRDCSGNAAAEMAFVTPLLLIVMTGCLEVGNYFWNEHILLKSVRDGARYAGRQDYSNFSTCSSTGTDISTSTVGTNTKLVVQKGSLDSTQPDLVPNWSTVNFKLTCQSITSAGGQQMQGMYVNSPNGAANIVTVEATVRYRPVMAVALGFSGVGAQLYAASQAAVSGI